MTRNEKKVAIENIAEKFVELSEENKAFIVGYMTGTQEERKRWEQKELQAEPA